MNGNPPEDIDQKIEQIDSLLARLKSAREERGKGAPLQDSPSTKEKILFEYKALVNSMVHIIAQGDPQKVEKLKGDTRLLLSTLREDYQSSRSQADEITALQAGLDDREQYLETLARGYPALEELKKMEQNALSLEDKLKELIQLKNALSTKVQQQEAEISGLKSTNSHLEESSEALNKDYQTLVKESRTQQERNAALQTALDEKDQHLQDQLALYRRLKQEKQKTEQELNEKNTLLETGRASKDSDLSDTWFELGRTQDELSEIKLKYSSLEEQLRARQAELEKEQRKNARSQEKLGRRDETISYLKQKKSQAEKSVQSSEKSVKSLKRDLKKNFRDYNSRNQALTQQLNSERKETQKKAVEVTQLEGQLTQLEDRLAREKERSSFELYSPSAPRRLINAAYKALVIGLLGGAAIIYSSQTPSHPPSGTIFPPKIESVAVISLPPASESTESETPFQLAACRDDLSGYHRGLLNDLSGCQASLSTTREEKATLTQQNIRLNTQLAALEATQQKDFYYQFTADPSSSQAEKITSQYLATTGGSYSFSSLAEFERFPDFVFAAHSADNDYSKNRERFLQLLYLNNSGRKTIERILAEKKTAKLIP